MQILFFETISCFPLYLFLLEKKKKKDAVTIGAQMEVVGSF